jgi:uncharacterized membrane protein YfhO
MMAAGLPGGEHEITLAYENPAFLAGALLSFASLLAIALLARGRALA